MQHVCISCLRSHSQEMVQSSARSHHTCSCRAEQPETPKQDKHIPADPNSARSRKLAAKKAKAKEVRNAKKLAAKARKQRAAERAHQATGGHHISAQNARTCAPRHVCPFAASLCTGML